MAKLETFSEFARARWGANWALCRGTARTKLLYDRCVSQAEYRAAERAWIEQRAAVAAKVGAPIDEETLHVLISHGLVDRFLTWKA